MFSFPFPHFFVVSLSPTSASVPTLSVSICNPALSPHLSLPRGGSLCLLSLSVHGSDQHWRESLSPLFPATSRSHAGAAGHEGLGAPVFRGPPLPTQGGAQPLSQGSGHIWGSRQPGQRERPRNRGPWPRPLHQRLLRQTRDSSSYFVIGAVLYAPWASSTATAQVSPGRRDVDGAAVDPAGPGEAGGLSLHWPQRSVWSLPQPLGPFCQALDTGASQRCHCSSQRLQRGLGCWTGF